MYLNIGSNQSIKHNNGNNTYIVNGKCGYIFIQHKYMYLEMLNASYELLKICITSSLKKVIVKRMTHNDQSGNLRLIFFS